MLMLVTLGLGMGNWTVLYRLVSQSRGMDSSLYQDRKALSRKRVVGFRSDEV